MCEIKDREIESCNSELKSFAEYWSSEILILGKKTIGMWIYASILLMLQDNNKVFALQFLGFNEIFILMFKYR